jgi:hypothetical protein
MFIHSSIYNYAFERRMWGGRVQFANWRRAVVVLCWGRSSCCAAMGPMCRVGSQVAANLSSSMGVFISHVPEQGAVGYA